MASQVSYECTPGNRLSGHRVRFCGPDGRWTGTSPKCEEIRCDAPGLPANGSAIYIGNDRSFKEQSFSVGVTVQYECDYGHVVKGSWSSRLCQANGEWSGEPPVCKFVDCGTPPSIENGNYILKHPPAGSASGSATPVEVARRSDGPGQSQTGGTFTYYGTIAHYSCDANFRLQGPAQRECLDNGQWRTPLPTCEPVQCPKPEYFDEFTQVALIPRSGQLAADASSSLSHSSDHQASITLASKSTKLIANNQWINHDSSSQSFGVGDKLYYSCVPGYELYGGPEIRTCTQYGQWSGSSTPRCRLIDCGRPSPIGQEGRFYLLNETTTFNSLVEYSCVRPFKLVEVKIRQAGNLIETLTNAQAGVTPILTSLPIGVKVCANNGQWMPNDQQPKCTSGGAPVDGTAGNSQFDGIDNTLDGSHRNVQVLAGTNNRPTFIGTNNNHDGMSDNSNLDAASGFHHQAGQSASTSLWAKIIIAICLLVMLALIILTLICIRSGKKPKQVIHRASILTPSGHQAAAAAAAMQIQLANGKGLQQQPPPQAPHHHHHHHHLQTVTSVQQAAASMMSGQNIYINGMHKMFPGSMLGQSQMSSGANHHLDHTVPVMTPYGDASQGGLVLANGNSSRSMVAINGGQCDAPVNGGGKASSLGMAGHQRIRTQNEHHPMSVSSSNILDSYSRLSIESDQTSAIGQHSTNKTIRHNPNGLVTFVSPAQQQQQSNRQQQQSVPTSQHQVSPQSISTSLSVSSSSSPSSSSSAHHTTATRLSATDSASSPSSASTNQHHHHVHNGVGANQQSEYQAPQQYIQAPPTPQSSPPSLPAHPPPPHRVQQHHKQLMKHQQNPSRHMAQASGSQQQQQPMLSRPSDQVGSQEQEH